MTRRPVLLLDVMDTLVHDPFLEEEPAFFGLGLEELLERKHPTAWVDFELGRIGEAEYFRRFFRDGGPVDGEAFRGRFVHAYRFLDGVEDLLGELSRAGVEMHALSNYPRWYRLIEEKLRLSRFLRWSFVSCHTGLRKPDPEAYLGAASALGRPPAECLFIDDRGQNCKAAAGSGMVAVKFTGAEALRVELAERGLLE